MLRKSIILVLAIGLAAGAAFAGGTELGWIDLKNCDMCSSLSPYEGLLESMAYETHPISNGVVCITTVGKDHVADYRKAAMGMMEMSKKIAAGEKFNLCGSCTARAAFLAKGPMVDYVETATGDVMIITSPDEALAKEMQAWAKRNTEEMAKSM